MNAVFHLAALAASVGLAWGLLRVQKQRDFLRGLLAGRRRVHVDGPVGHLRTVAAALGVSFEFSGAYDLPPRRIQRLELFENLAGRGLSLSLIRCSKPAADTGGDLLVELVVAGEAPAWPAAEQAEVEAAAAAALGAKVLVKLVKA